MGLRKSSQNEGLTQRQRARVGADQARQQGRADMADVEYVMAAFAQFGRSDRRGRLLPWQRLADGGRRQDPCIEKARPVIVDSGERY